MILTMNNFQSAVKFSGEYKNTGRLWVGILSNLARICLPTVPRKGSLLLLSCKYLNNNNFILTCSRLQDRVGKAHREKLRKVFAVSIPWFLCTGFWYTLWLVNLTVDVNHVSRLSSQPRFQGSLSFFDQKPWLRLVTWLPKSERQKQGRGPRVNNCRYDKSHSVRDQEEFAASFIRELKQQTDDNGYKNAT